MGKIQKFCPFMSGETKKYVNHETCSQCLFKLPDRTDPLSWCSLRILAFEKAMAVESAGGDLDSSFRFYSETKDEDI